MRIQLPVPYPDELLYGVLSRYLARVGPVGDSALIKAVFGRFCRVQVDIPPFLDIVSKGTFEFLGLTALELALLHTLFPYYAYSSDVASVLIWVQSLNLPSTVRKRSLLGAKNTWKNSASLLQICPECHAADMTNYGESYWRRLHQLPGVLICPQHECFLWPSTASGLSYSAPRFADATTSLPRERGARTANRLSRRSVALQIAHKSQDLLNTPVLVAFDIHRQYQALLREIALPRPEKNGSDHWADAIVDYFGLKLLDAIGVKSMSWVRNIMHTKPYLFHTLEHILFQIFLETYLPYSKSLPIKSAGDNQWGDKSVCASLLNPSLKGLRADQATCGLSRSA